MIAHVKSIVAIAGSTSLHHSLHGRLEKCYRKMFCLRWWATSMLVTNVGDKICWWQFYLFLISFRSLSKNEGSEVLLNTGTGWSGIGTSKNAQTGSQPSFKFHISSRSRGTFSMTLALWALKNILYGMSYII